MDKLLFSVCLGDYDTIPPLLPMAGFRHVMFTDNPELKCEGWELFLVEPEKDLLRQSRKIKLCPHLYIDADLYVYLDANQEIQHDLTSLLNSFKRGLMTVRHPVRSCVYEEIEQCRALKKAHHKTLIAQQKAYQREEMPANTGMFANGFFVRDRSFDQFCERWYEEIEKYSHRDQISFAYLVWKYQPEIMVVEHQIRDYYLRTLPHKNEKKARPDIWYFIPGDGKKQYGEALNRHCEMVPDGDWICIRDNDTCALAPFINKQIEDIVAKHGHRYDLLSCYTNRLGLAHQLPFGLSDNPDILHHKKIADEFFKDYYDQVEESPKPTAGLFMLFPKKTWQNNRFVPGLANSPNGFVDYQFAQGVLNSGGKIGICKGIYLFHAYRIGQANVREHKHLMV